MRASTSAIERQLVDDLIGMACGPLTIPRAPHRPGEDRLARGAKGSGKTGGQVAYVVGEEIGLGPSERGQPLHTAAQPALLLLGDYEAPQDAGRVALQPVRHA